MPQPQILQLNSEEAYKLLTKLKADKDRKVVFSLSIVTLPEFINTQDTMDLIGCSREKLRQLVNEGIIKKVRHTIGENRYNRAEIQQLLDDGRI